MIYATLALLQQSTYRRPSSWSTWIDLLKSTSPLFLSLKRSVCLRTLVDGLFRRRKIMRVSRRGQSTNVSNARRAAACLLVFRAHRLCISAEVKREINLPKANELHYRILAVRCTWTCFIQSSGWGNPPYSYDSSEAVVFMRRACSASYGGEGFCASLKKDKDA